MIVAKVKMDWRDRIVECPYCGAIQMERVLVNVTSLKGIYCFYCGESYAYDHHKDKSLKL